MRFSPDRLRAAREAAGLSLDDAAEATGHDPVLIARFENGRDFPLPLAHLSRLATAYGVPLTNLYDPDDPTDPITAIDALIRRELGQDRANNR